MKADKIVFGERYVETVLGREGVATGLCHYMTGCSQVCLEWLGKDEKRQAVWFDIGVIKVAPKKSARVKIDKKAPNGGPHDNAPDMSE